MAVTDHLSALATRNAVTPQHEQAAPEQIRNAAGGYTFAVTDEQIVDRFLITGTAGGTYYTSERELTKDTGGRFLDICRGNGQYVVDRVVEISTAGRALRQNPGLFALAAVSALATDDTARKAAFDAVPAVARTMSTRRQWLAYRLMFGGKGPATERTIRRWFDDADVSWLAYQGVKYGVRNAWSYRDLLMIGRPADHGDAARKALYRWMLGKDDYATTAPLDGPLAILAAWDETRSGDVDTIVRRIANPGLPHEAVPSTVKDDPRIWRALIDNDRLPITALIRNLATMTRAGVFAPMTPYASIVASRITSKDRLVKGRVHPMALLLAQATYASGGSAVTGKSWEPVQRLVDALNAAFYDAFATVEPTNQRILVAVDVSPSMANAPVAGSSLSCAGAAAALSLIFAKTEPNAHLVCFSSEGGGAYGYRRGNVALRPLPVSPHMRLEHAVAATQGLSWGGTDVALPMVWATQQRLPVDCFVILTDNETWAGHIHPHEALRDYRRQSGLPSSLVVCSMTATGATVADPADPRQIDVAGLDANIGRLVAEFARGA